MAQRSEFGKREWLEQARATRFQLRRPRYARTFQSYLMVRACHTSRASPGGRRQRAIRRARDRVPGADLRPDPIQAITCTSTDDGRDDIVWQADPLAP